MNETEKDRILKMVAEGTLRPNEAAHLLAALAEASPATANGKAPEEKAETKVAPQTVEVRLERPDGTYTTISVPPNLGPMLVKLVGVAIRESARTAAQETWDGLKTIARNKTRELQTNIKERVNGSKKETAPSAPPPSVPASEARRRIIQMVQNGRISATDAARLIEQIDALQDHQRAPSVPRALAK